MTVACSRRAVLGGLAAAAAGGVSLAAEIARAAARAPVAVPTDTFDRFIRLRSAPRHAPVMWLSDGLLFVKLDGAHARALVRSTSLAWTQVIPRADGVYDFRLEEVGFYRDLATGAKLERWTNPVTGRESAPPHYRTPEALQLRRDGTRAVGSPAGTEFRAELVTLAEQAGDVSIGEDLYVRIPARDAVPATATTPARPARPERFLASFGTYTAKLADLARPPDAWVDTAFGYSTMNGLSEWLGFGEAKGVQNLRLTSSKRPHDALDAIPAWLRDRIERDHPTFLDVPRRWLADGGPARDGVQATK